MAKGWVNSYLLFLGKNPFDLQWLVRTLWACLFVWSSAALWSNTPSSASCMSFFCKWSVPSSQWLSYKDAQLTKAAGLSLLSTWTFCRRSRLLSSSVLNERRKTAFLLRLLTQHRCVVEWNCISCDHCCCLLRSAFCHIGRAERLRSFVPCHVFNPFILRKRCQKLL